MFYFRKTDEGVPHCKHIHKHIFDAVESQNEIEKKEI